MQEASLVRELNRFGNGLHVGGGAFGRQRLVADELRQVRAIHKVHREVMLALLHADFMNGDDVRMLKARRRRSFDAEAVDELFARVLAEEEHLDRNHPVEAQLARLIDDAHAAARDFFQEFIIAEAPRQIRITTRLRTILGLLKPRAIGFVQTSEEQAARTNARRGQAAEWLAALKANFWFSRCAHVFISSATALRAKCYNGPCETMPIKCRSSSSTSAGVATVEAISARRKSR